MDGKLAHTEVAWTKILAWTKVFESDVCIPVLVGAIGGVLGVVAMFTMPSFPANDVLTSIAIGIMSGLASTGSNQIYKQLQKFFKGE